MKQLSHPYSGGSQSRSQSWLIRKCGCGAVAMADLLLYLTGRKPADYDRFCQALQLKYLPTLPPFGTTGLSLAAGFNLFCRNHKLPYTARWNLSGKTLWARMDEMLERDFPVILSIAPNLVNQKLKLYRKRGDTYTAAAKAKAHFVTVTGMDDHWLRVSSWGKEYYIHREEYWEYGRKYSGFVTHNLLYITTTSCPLTGGCQRS